MDVILLTNRTVQIFDSLGDEMLHFSRAFSAQPDAEFDIIERKAINEIYDLMSEPSVQETKFYIASVRGSCWKQEITLCEFATLLGHSCWYWETQKNCHKDYGA